ncbi:MAG: NRDE family protein [bacterium]
MCILFIAIGQHPRYPLIIAANRDEYHARAREMMRYWRDAPAILAGRDRVAGGTWFGVNTRGRIAAVANHRALSLARGTDASTDGRSRGELVARFLRGEDSPAQYADFLRRCRRDFRPFNLLYGTPDRLLCASSAEARPRELARGFHSISNGDLDDPWPKMSRGVSLLREAIAAAEPDCELDCEKLARAMRDQTQADDALLPDTGLPRAREKHLSSIFIADADYGTRATTLLLAAPGAFELREYNYAPNGIAAGTRRYSLQINPER